MLQRPFAPYVAVKITIPAAFRKELGIGDDTMLRMTLA